MKRIKSPARANLPHTIRAVNKKFVRQLRSTVGITTVFLELALQTASPNTFPRDPTRKQSAVSKLEAHLLLVLLSLLTSSDCTANDLFGQEWLRNGHFNGDASIAHSVESDESYIYGCCLCLIGHTIALSLSLPHTFAFPHSHLP